MEITFFGNGDRGLACLQQLCKNNYKINCVVVHSDKRSQWLEYTEPLGLELISPDNPNEASVIDFLKNKNSDLFVLAGYGKIIKNKLINLPRLMCINLHGGRLPQYRGSSPMNWALIKGDSSFSLSIIKVDEGVDTGDVLLERAFSIRPNDTIVDLHKTANEEFPSMLIEVVRSIQSGTYSLRQQDSAGARYFPLRFPEDGLIVWDLMTAQEIHNQIRALTEPYPCAFTYYKNRKVKLLSSELPTTPFLGEPGRIYRKTKRGLLICAKDQSLWIKESYLAEENIPLSECVQRYESLITAKWSAIKNVQIGVAS